MMRVLSLFAGIGGFDLGLERTGGFKTVAFCEIDPFCRRVLAKHWPEVPCYDDVRSVTAGLLAADGVVPDVVCGGFPCQDISFAGAGAGLAGARSGLWHEMLRIIGETRPRYVIAENVSALRSRGLDVVLGGLAAVGYDAEWHCIPAAAVGAPHRRDRVWIVAYANGQGEHAGAVDAEMGSASEPLADANGRGLWPGQRDVRAGQPDVDRCCAPLANASGPGQPEVRRSGENAGFAGLGTALSRGLARCGGGDWLSEPDVGRVADGVPARVDRLRSLGNAVVPQIPELIGRAILASQRAAA